MSKGFIPYKKLKLILNDHLNNNTALGKAVKQHCSDTLENEYFKSAARLVRFFSDDFTHVMSIFEKEFKNHGIDIKTSTLFSSTPLLIFNKTKGTIYIFKNIPLVFSKKEHLGYVNDITSFSVLDEFIIKYKKDISDVNLQKQWANFRRGWKKIKSYEEISVAKVIHNYLNIPCAISDHTKRDIALAIQERLQPLKLLFTNKPEDYTTMYTGGPDTCISSHKRDRWEELTLSGLVPASFYHWFPYTTGVYAKLGTKVVARCIVFNFSGKSIYGRIYVLNGDKNINDKFVDALNSHGYSPLNKNNVRSIDERSKILLPNVEFSILGISDKAKKIYYCPIPYFDNIKNSVFIEFKKLTNEFILTICNDKNPIQKCTIPGDLQIGYMTSQQCEVLTCSFCEKLINGITAKFATDGSSFCDIACAAQKNYIHVNTTEGMQLMQMRDDLIVDTGNGNHHPIYYSTIEAANRHKVYAVLDTVEQAESFNDVKSYSKINIRNYLLSASYPCWLINQYDLKFGITQKLRAELQGSKQYTPVDFKYISLAGLEKKQIEEKQAKQIKLQNKSTKPPALEMRFNEVIEAQPENHQWNVVWEQAPNLDRFVVQNAGMAINEAGFRVGARARNVRVRVNNDPGF